MTDRQIHSISPAIPVLESPRTPKFVSPSRIARYYFHECDRLLRYSSTPKEARIAEGVPKPPYDTRPVTRAILDSGFAWEEEVLRAHLQDRVLVAAGVSTRVSERVHTVEETKRLLIGLRPGEHLYQGTLATPPTFYERYGLDTSVVRMSDCRPDLVECYEDADGAVRLRVVDIKASPGLKLSHRIQATLYTLILDHLLEHWEVRDRRVSDEGGIWLAGASAAETFPIRAMRPPLETFLEHELQPLLEGPADQARWHLHFRCEWCEYFDHCRQETLTTDNVSRLPYLSSHAKRYLGELQPPVVSMPDLDALLTDAQRAPALDDCASMRGEQKRLLSQVTAMETGEVIPLGGASLAMPKAENVRLVLTLQREPVSGKVYAYAVLAQGLRDVLGENPAPMVGVAPTGSATDVAELERALVRDLHGLLLAVDRYNEEREGDWKAQKSLQAFTFDSYERDLLTEVLLRRLVDPVVAEAAMDVFFHFQRPELVRADDHPANEVFFPVVVLTAVLRQQVALPVDVAYRFADAVRLLRPSQFPFDYTPKDYYSFELSNQLRSDAIFSVWTQGKAERVAGIATELKARVRATSALINGLREELAPSGVVAGDDRQLPPIVLGTYPAPEECAPLLHRSIFECLRQRDVGERLTATLLENFRMNRVLCRYPAEQVYVPEYTSADDSIGERRLALGGSMQGDLVDRILDPEYPLVVGVLSGVRATAENRIEASLVAATANRVRDRLLGAGGQSYPHTREGDAAFWKHGLFIVSPHHAQINAIHRALGQTRDWRCRPFVDTVDKMQGQECDAVITSYGVSDVEYAMNEKEFIYSLNRLNVAITRARAKSIVFLPQPLIEPPIQAFEDDETAVGVAFMQGLVQFAERHGVVSEHELGDGAVLRLLRVSHTGVTHET